MNNRIAAALLFTHIDDIRGGRIVSFPFSDFCDPFVDEGKAWCDVSAPLLARNVPIQIRCLRNDIPAADSRFRTVGQLAWHGTDLTRSEAEIWSGFAKNARRYIMRAERIGLVARESSALEDLRTFHTMHCHVRKSKYNLLAQPFAFFEHLHAGFVPSDSLVVMIAEYHGSPVAGAIFFVPDYA